MSIVSHYPPEPQAFYRQVCALFNGSQTLQFSQEWNDPGIRIRKYLDFDQTHNNPFLNDTKSENKLPYRGKEVRNEKKCLYTKFLQ